MAQHYLFPYTFSSMHQEISSRQGKIDSVLPLAVLSLLLDKGVYVNDSPFLNER